jgi:hypothetical protein
LRERAVQHLRDAVPHGRGITAFAGIATSEAVPGNEKKEWFLRKASAWWSKRATAGGSITSTGVSALGKLGLARG